MMADVVINKKKETTFPFVLFAFSRFCFPIEKGNEQKKKKEREREKEKNSNVKRSSPFCSQREVAICSGDQSPDAADRGN